MEICTKNCEYCSNDNYRKAIIEEKVLVPIKQLQKSLNDFTTSMQYITKKKISDDADDVITLLDKLRKENGDQVIIVETPQGSVSLKIKDALIYRDAYGDIVIDAE